MLPFTGGEFISIFAAYNAGAWPVQVLAYLVGLLIVIVLARRSPASGRIIGAGVQHSCWTCRRTGPSWPVVLPHWRSWFVPPCAACPLGRGVTHRPVQPGV